MKMIARVKARDGDVRRQAEVANLDTVRALSFRGFLGRSTNTLSGQTYTISPIMQYRFVTHLLFLVHRFLFW